MKLVLDCGLALRPAEASDLPYVAECIRESLTESVTDALISLKSAIDAYLDGLAASV